MKRYAYVKDTDDSKIDLTPMLDVVFIMLIFFIVTASFIKESGFEVDTPPNSQSTGPSDKIVFEVNSHNEIWLEGRLIDIRAIRANVERFHAENPKASVIIRADKASRAKTYAGIADYARQANVHNVILSITESKTI